jgi:hypothetical protein
VVRDCDALRSSSHLRLGVRGRAVAWINDQLELDVVRVAQNEEGDARDRVGRRDCGVDDFGGCQPRRPGIKFRGPCLASRAGRLAAASFTAATLVVGLGLSELVAMWDDGPVGLIERVQILVVSRWLAGLALSLPTLPSPP